jgi:hypothetical protein
LPTKKVGRPSWNLRHAEEEWRGEGDEENEDEHEKEEEGEYEKGRREGAGRGCEAQKGIA